MFCTNCGKEIDSNAYVCPHCGVQLHKEEPRVKPNNTLAIVGFVLSFFIPIAGLICSIIAYNKSKEINDVGKSFSLAGIIISAVILSISVLLAL